MEDIRGSSNVFTLRLALPFQLHGRLDHLNETKRVELQHRSLQERDNRNDTMEDIQGLPDLSILRAAIMPQLHASSRPINGIKRVGLLKRSPNRT